MKGVLWPAAVCGGLFLISAMLPQFLRHVVRSSSLGFAVSLTFLFLVGVPVWPWLGAPAGLLLVTLLVPLFTIFDLTTDTRRGLARLFSTWLVMLIILWPLVRGLWTNAQIVQLFLVLGLGVVFVLWATDIASEQMKPAAVSSVLMVSAAGAAGFFALDGSASLSQLSGALAAGFGIVVALSFFNIFKPGYEFNLAGILFLLSLGLAHFCYSDTAWQTNWWVATPLAMFMFRSVVPLIFQQAINDVIFSVVFSAAPICWFLWNLFKSQGLM